MGQVGGDLVIAATTVVVHSGDSIWDKVFVYGVLPLFVLGLAAFATSVYRLLKSGFGDVRELKVAWVGTPVTEFAPAQPGAMDKIEKHGEDLTWVKDQLKTNGGGTLKDDVGALKVGQEGLKADIATIADEQKRVAIHLKLDQDNPPRPRTSRTRKADAT